MKTHETHPLAGFGTARGPVLSLLFLCLALTASAKTFEWRINSPQARAETFTAYHGETIKFNLVLSGAMTNLTPVALYYTTNSVGSSASPAEAETGWRLADNLTFHPTNDVGAASYRFFIRSTDPEGVNYTANGLLRLLDSPGFVPNTLAPPVAVLDFDLTEVLNAPYYTKSETDATTQALMAEVSSASQSATNYTDSASQALMAAIAAAEPGNYAVVSNKAMSALQSYTETDPTVSSWAKAATKPTYSLNEICPNSENWLGVPGTTAGGKSIKVLAKTVNGVIEGGMTVTGSSNNDNNTTKYRYAGVTVTRNGTATDYLFDANSQSGIVRRSELPSIPQYSETNAVSTIVWHYGAETLTIPSGGTLSASTTGWNNGESMFLVLSPSGSYTVDTNAVAIVGYNAWPTNATLCVAFRYGAKILVNPITATE